MVQGFFTQLDVFYPLTKISPLTSGHSVYIRSILNIYGYTDHFVGCHFLTYQHQKILKLKKMGRDDFFLKMYFVSKNINSIVVS